ncbi:hypothetical protein C8F04DRAFT_1111248 [Mycena alexandri]|uniref:MYND-type domain-containing protein n=1 Tax=Mycena alexandri TaxID=1745969 RepID=A0AAD6X1E1_9AGAR|nr:hypothetical protein C8F04DRAFT_1111248 [Mycena alexandri]
MHPSLDLQNLSRFPPPLRAIATRASQGSLEDLIHLVSALEDSEPPKDISAYLPVFHANLNPSPDIPHRREFISTTNSRAIVALRGLDDLKFGIPKEVLPELWPRIWKWASFLHTSELDMIGEILLLISAVIHHSADVISSTPGVRKLIVRGWKLIYEQPGGPPVTPGYHSCVMKILTKMKVANPIHLHEFIQGAGGDIEDVATLLTRSLYHYFPTSRHPFNYEGFMWIDAVFHALGDLKILDSPHMKKVFLDAGLVGSLINIICVFSVSQLRQLDDITLDALHLLQNMLEYSSEEVVLRQAVAAGLLRGLMSCSVIIAGHDIVAQLFRTTLSRGTIYRSVLSEISQSLPELDAFAASPSFIASAFFTGWRDFRALVQGRMDLTKIRNIDVTRKACGDMNCQEIRRKSEFQRCGRCHSVYYCNPRCQRADWTLGGHRTQCELIRTSMLASGDALTSRNTFFVRVVLNDEYETNKQHVLARQLGCLQTHPSALLVTIFDYSSGRARIDVQPASTLLKDYPYLNWRDYLPRALRSEGRMELHLVLVPTGESGMQAWLFSLRSTLSALQDGVRALAAATAQFPDPSAELLTLVENCRRSVVQIHQ